MELFVEEDEFPFEYIGFKVMGAYPRGSIQCIVENRRKLRLGLKTYI